PSRQEIRQFDELSLALIDSVSSDAKRYVAALISANPFAPRALVMRLCEEAPAISAPLISRSPLLNATDIVNLIARFGKGHARPAASRQSLDPAVRAMLALLVKDEAEADRTPTTSEPRREV